MACLRMPCRCGLLPARILRSVFMAHMRAVSCVMLLSAAATYHHEKHPAKHAGLFNGCCAFCCRECNCIVPDNWSVINNQVRCAVSLRCDSQ